MKRIFKIICCILSAAAVCGGMYTAAGAFDAYISDVAEEQNRTAGFIYEKNPAPEFSQTGGEWVIFGTARSGYDVPQEYYSEYYTKIKKLAVEADFTAKYKPSDYARLILALTSIGADVCDVSGKNLLEGISDYERTISQGINGAVWALIALNSGKYTLPVVTAEEGYINYILSSENEDGGWSIDGNNVSEADITAMAAAALSNYSDRPEVAKAVEKAFKYLAKTQNDDGTYSSCGLKNAESTAQVIVALCENEIPLSDERFIKNNNSLEDALMKFSTGNGGFKHTLSDSTPNMMATEQALYAMAAAVRAKTGKNKLFDISDPKMVDFFDPIGLPDKILAVHAREKIYDISFSDISGVKYENEINELASYGIINGKSESIFEPQSRMTRAEFATITVNALCLDKIENDVFSDVSENDWFFENVNTAYSYNIIKGISEAVFNPNGIISRQEAAVMVTRAATLCGMDTGMSDTSIRNTLSAFTDYINTPEWAREALAFCYSQNILDGSELEIDGFAAVTRGEIAHMMYTMLKNADLIR